MFSRRNRSLRREQLPFQLSHVHKVNGDQQYVGEDPRHRTCHDGSHVAKGGNKAEADQRPCRQFADTCHHRHQAVAHALQGIPQDKEHAQHRIEDRVQTHVLYCQLNDFCFRGIEEQVCGVFSQNPQESNAECTVTHGNVHAQANAVADPVKLFGTQILSAEGCHCDAK